jgi:hypothetical protein
VSARKIEIEREREREREKKKKRRIREDLGLFVVGGVCFLAVRYYYIIIFIFGVKNKRMRNSFTQSFYRSISFAGAFIAKL